MYADNMQIASNAVITGASGCLGRELAVLFSATDHVILSGRSVQRLEETNLQCGGPISTTLVYGNLLSSVVQERLNYFADIYSVQYLICCNGVYGSSVSYDEIIASNFTATVKTVESILPVFKRRGCGVIVNINSLAGKNASPTERYYSAAKHGLSGFFKALRLELRESGIRVLDVYLGALKGSLMQNRKDYAYLIEPKEAAEVIYNIAVLAPPSLQIEDITIGRFDFPD